MADPIKRALTCRRLDRGAFIIDEPDPTLVYIVKFGLGMSVCLCALEIASMAFLHSWNSEVFSGITALVVMVAGVFVGRKQ